MADTDGQDLYKLLGVARSATKQELQAAYKKKARKLHPDVNKSPDAEDRFKEVAAAYAILKDAEQRKHYDTYGIHRKPSSRNRGPSPQARPPSGRASQPGFRPSDFGFGDIRFEDINIDSSHLKNPFDFFMRREERRRRTKEREVNLKISLKHSYLGTTLNMLLDLPTELGLTETKRIAIKIPKGAKDGDRLKLKDPDCTVVLSFDPHPQWLVEGRDVHTTLDISPWEGALGGKVTFITPGGPLTLKVPPGSSTGQKLRLRGKGLPLKPGRPGDPGDLYATLRIMSPRNLSGEQQRLFERLAEISSFDPRTET